MPSIREMLLEVQTQLGLLKFCEHGNYCILTESVFRRATDEQPTRPQLTLDSATGIVAAPRCVQTPRPENLCHICGVTSSGLRFRAYPSKADVLVDYAACTNTTRTVGKGRDFGWWIVMP